MRASLTLIALLAACGTTPTPPTPPVPATEPVATEPAPPPAPTEPAPAPAAPTSPIAGTWTVTEVGSAPLAEGQSADLTFSDDGKVSGKCGCNRASGTYTVGGAGVSFGPLATTRMMCPPADMDLESRILKVLTGDVQFSVEADVLTLQGPGGSLRAKR